MKEAQDTGEDFSPQKRTISTLKHKFLPFSYFLSVIFSLLDPDPADQKQCGFMRTLIWIHSTGFKYMLL
jgi:hypothetical protein